MGAIPQYALSVGLFDQRARRRTWTTCRALGGIGGSYGGAWPASTWKTFMTTEFTNLPVASLPTPDYGAPFVQWVQVRAAGSRRSRSASRASPRTARCPQWPELPAEPEPVCQQAVRSAVRHRHRRRRRRAGLRPGAVASPSPTPTCAPPVPAAATCTPSPASPCGRSAADATLRRRRLRRLAGEPWRSRQLL